MKTWIIILTSVWIVLFLLSKAFVNWALNDREEKVQIYFNGYSTHTIVAGFCKIMGYVTLVADVILALIYFL